MHVSTSKGMHNRLVIPFQTSFFRMTPENGGTGGTHLVQRPALLTGHPSQQQQGDGSKQQQAPSPSVQNSPRHNFHQSIHPTRCPPPESSFPLPLTPSQSLLPPHPFPPLPSRLWDQLMTGVQPDASVFDSTVSKSRLPPHSRSGALPVTSRCAFPPKQEVWPRVLASAAKFHPK
jgi:hypothetical protein